MITSAIETLQLYEEMVLERKIKTFTVLISETGIVIKPSGKGTEREVPLTQELQHSIKTYFYEVKSFDYGSLDYTTLRSLINARVCLERMTKNAKS